MLGMSGPGIVGSSGLSATRTAGHELRLFGIAGSDELRAIEESSRPRNGRVESNAEIVFVNCLLAIERIAHGHTLFLGLRSVAVAARALFHESIHATRHESHAQYLVSPGG